MLCIWRSHCHWWSKLPSANLHIHSWKAPRSTWKLCSVPKTRWRRLVGFVERFHSLDFDLAQPCGRNTGSLQRRIGRAKQSLLQLCLPRPHMQGHHPRWAHRLWQRCASPRRPSPSRMLSKRTYCNLGWAEYVGVFRRDFFRQAVKHDWLFACWEACWWEHSAHSASAA